ncbi:MAG: hypothetical protein ACJ79S_12240 [Gemmatimonadaceae bacterium]
MHPDPGTPRRNASAASGVRGAREPDAARAPARVLTGLQAESWRLLWQQLLRDPEALAECRIWEERRRRALPGMRDLLRRFASGEAELEELRATVDRRTRTDWDAFGLRGASGAMFLNRLARATPDPARVAAALRRALELPRDAEEARARLAAFMAELHDVAAGPAGPGEGAAAGGALQPARAGFFVSVWWHAQDTERWPIFQPSARRALREEGDVFTPSGDPARDYVLFRDAFLAVASTVRATAWETEYLCWWRQQRGGEENGDVFYEPGVARAPAAVREARPRVARAVPAPAARPATAGAADGGTRLQHTHVQWVLARLGRKLGCRVWIAANDWTKRWEGQALGDLSARRLPSLGLSADSQRIVSLIDVVWLRGGNEVAAAFEIEHTTSVYSGLLRMADLAALSPNLSFPLYIVAPRARLDKVRREIVRPAFRALGLDRRCAFFSGEALLDAADSIMRWATDPSAIERLASRADDVGGDRRAD